MSEGIMPLLFDVLIVILLGATIFYAAKLSVYLKSFREGRVDMEKLIRELSSSIIRAESAVQSMKDNAADSGQELDQLITRAKGVSQELQIINEVGDNLANRLERAANSVNNQKDIIPEVGLNKAKIDEVDSSPSDFDEMFPSFNIVDPEFDSDEFDDDWDGMDDLQSDAEKELFRALRKNENK